MTSRPARSARAPSARLGTTILYVYAVLAEAAPERRGRGLGGEPVRLLACVGLQVAVGEIDAPPTLTAEALRGHHRTVERLARRARAILPARFGCVVADDRALERVLRPRRDELREALALVAGREQMTLRVYGRAAPATVPAAVTARPQGRGTRYLAERKREHDARAAVPEIDPVRGALGSLICAERTERHEQPPLLATAYHLIERGRSGAYRDRIAEAAHRLHGLRVQASGPWAPYAFAPEAMP